MRKLHVDTGRLWRGAEKRNSGRELEVVRVVFERQGQVLVPPGT